MEIGKRREMREGREGKINRGGGKDGEEKFPALL